MAQDQEMPQDIQQKNEEEKPTEPYGWEFHKIPLLIAFVLTLLFYAFVFFFIHF